MLETLTRLNSAIPAFLRASSKLESFSLFLPVPLVTKAFVGINSAFLRFGVQVILACMALSNTTEMTG